MTKPTKMSLPIRDALTTAITTRAACVACLQAAAEDGLSAREAIEGTQRYLRHRNLPHVADPIALATGGRQCIGDGSLDRILCAI